MDKRSRWSCLVNEQGEISEWEDKAGADYFAELRKFATMHRHCSIQIKIACSLL